MKSRLSAVIIIATLVAVMVLSGGARGSSANSISSPAGPALLGTVSSSTPSAKRSASSLAPIGSGFTYQGRLNNNGSPADGQYDLQFTLYDALSAGNVVGTP